MSEVVYRVQGLQHSYDDQSILAVKDLTVYRGEIFVIVGPSGAGKSTLLRLLGFLEEPSAGTIMFGNSSYAKGTPMPMALRRSVATVFQRPQLLKRSVYANVEYGLRLRGHRNGRERILHVLAQVGLEQQASRRASSLSGGEAQRVAVARALVLEPDVLLLDEPTANLDPHNVAIIEGIVEHANRNSETTVMLVTHNIFQARRLAHRVGLMMEGRFVEIAEAGEFFRSPTDARAAAFVTGEMVY